MKSSRPYLGLFLLLAGSWAAAAQVSAWDEDQLQVLEHYPAALRWDNIEGAPQWVSGSTPRYDFRERRHFVSLSPGGEIVLRADANTWLRLAGRTTPLRPEDLVIGISTDARMFVDTSPMATVDPHALVVALPRDNASLVRLRRPPQAGSNLVFAIFLSRSEPPGTVAPYRETVRLPGKALGVRREGDAGSRPAWQLTPGEPIEFRSKGPARLQLVTLLRWPLTEPLREQSLVLHITRDDGEPIPLFLSPELDSGLRTWVDHSPELVSYRMNGYLEVPEGDHRLRVEASAPAYLSVFRQAGQNLLFPGLNGPPEQPVASLHSNSDQGLLVSAKAPGSNSPALTPAGLTALEQEAWRLARDNEPMAAGAQAADWLNRLTQSLAPYPPARPTAETLTRQRTVYREVLPKTLAAGQHLKEAGFITQRIRSLFEPEEASAVYNPTLEHVEGRFITGRFVPIPADPSTALLYELPARSHESRLRIAALHSSAARAHLQVQLDDGTPIRVSLDAASAIPPDNRETSGAVATLRALEAGVRLPTAAERGPAFGGFDLPFELTTPGVVEVPLPQGVRQVRLSGEPTDAPVLASVAYRAAKHFELGETGYLALLDQVGTEAAMQALAAPQNMPGTNATVVQELHNHLLPLARQLRSHANQFADGEDAFRPPLPAHPIDTDRAATLKDSARTLEREGQLIEALQVWNQLFWSGTPADQTEAATAIMRCLGDLDEDFLATQYARFLLLNATGASFPAPAVDFLEAAARHAEDTEQLEQLRAFLFLRCPCTEHLSALTEALILNGEQRPGLFTGLMLPREHRPAERMLEAALHQNWWQTFDQLVETLDGEEMKCYWRAQRHLALLRFTEAQQELQQSGDSGREMLRALERGMAIRQQLGAAEPGTRVEALFAWEQWQTEQPGPRTWEPLREVAQECPGSELLYNVEQDQFTTQLRSEPRRPVQLCFLGPLRLRVEARPILGVPFERPANDWLEIAEYGITNRIPVSQCVPNPNLEFATGSVGLVGTKTAATLEWGPGWHEVQVSLANHPALIRVLEQQPVFPTRILPTLNPRRLDLVLQPARPGRPGPKVNPVGNEPVVLWLPPEMGRLDAARSTAALPAAGGILDAGLQERFIGLTDVERLRLALRMSSTPTGGFEYERGLLQHLPPVEQWLAACRAQRWNEFTNGSALPGTVQANALLAAGRVQDLLGSDAPQDIVARLTALLQLSELDPEWREHALCQAEFIGAETNCPPEARRILLRLLQDRTWLALNISPSSAGIRPLPVSIDLPQAPATRLRRALLPPAQTNQFTLSAQSELKASVTLKEPATLELHTALVRAGFSPLTALRVGLQVDADEIEYLSLTPRAPEIATHIALPAGPHLVRLWIDDPVMNQWVRVRVAGGADDLTHAFESQPLAQVASERRFFHAATAEQPVRFSLKGPALLRVDEDRAGRFVSRLQLVPPGDQTVEIPPAPGAGESWYQIFVRATQTNRAEKRMALAIRTPEPVPPPKLRLPESAAPSQVQLTDYYEPGGQEDGTWTPGMQWVKRRPFELSNSQNTVENEFFEANVAHRKATPSDTLWFKSEGLARLHQPGDLTFGLSERVEGHPEFSAFDWLWRGEGFVGTVGPQQEDVQWSLRTGLELRRRLQINRKLDLYPLAGLFARYLSLDAGTAGTYNYIDQDLYTPYQDDHRWGGVLGSQVEYRPWRDTLIEGSAHLTSNQDFSPDHLGLRLTWTQLMGPFRGRVGYRCRYFLDDDDRSSAELLQGVSAGLYAEHWINGTHRIEIGAEFSHDWPDSGNSYFLVLRCDLSKGRRYRDYAPQEMAFRELRSRRIPGAFNNLLEPGPPGTYLP